MERFRRAAIAAVVSGGLVGAALLAGPATALAYGNATGNGALYQIEISANSVGPAVADHSTGGGGWFWIELDKDGTGDYTGSDCVHGDPVAGSGAFPDSGEVSWSSDGDTLTIDGVALVGGLVPVTITLPDAYVHYRTTIGDFLKVDVPGFPLPDGWAEITIAP